MDQSTCGWKVPFVLAVLFGCGDADGVSYKKQVQPLFARRCATCHHSDNTLGLVDIEDPFTQDEPPGLVGSVNIWWDGHREQLQYNVVAYEPDASFILKKITDLQLQPSFCDPATEECETEAAGFFMPPAPRRLRSEQIADIRQWITDGATDTPFFRSNVTGIFGDPTPSGDYCREVGSVHGCIMCTSCHYTDGPEPLDLLDPRLGLLGPDGLGASAAFRPDLKLVEPGNPDASFLVMKLEATALPASADLAEEFEPSSLIGAPMPYGYSPLLPAQVELIRQWILEGARNN
jgi:hypothetical protein